MPPLKGGWTKTYTHFVAIIIARRISANLKSPAANRFAAITKRREESRHAGIVCDVCYRRRRQKIMFAHRNGTLIFGVTAKTAAPILRQSGIASFSKISPPARTLQINAATALADNRDKAKSQYPPLADAFAFLSAVICLAYRAAFVQFVGKRR